MCSAYGGAWLGVAQIWISGGHIYQATTKVNDFYFKAGSKYNTPAWRRLVMCQEIGHTFGLDHQDENFSNANLGSCMDYTSDPDGPPSNEHPNSHDFQQLTTIYSGHKDGTTSADQASAQNVPPPAMNEIDFEGPGQWGKLVRSTHGGRLEQYELDFGGGHKIFTFVIWPDEEIAGAASRADADLRGCGDLQSARCSLPQSALAAAEETHRHRINPGKVSRAHRG